MLKSKPLNSVLANINVSYVSKNVLCPYILTSYFSTSFNIKNINESDVEENLKNNFDFIDLDIKHFLKEEKISIINTASDEFDYFSGNIFTEKLNKLQDSLSLNHNLVNILSKQNILFEEFKSIYEEIIGDSQTLDGTKLKVLHFLSQKWNNSNLYEEYEFHYMKKIISQLENTDFSILENDEYMMVYDILTNLRVFSDEIIDILEDQEIFREFNLDDPLKILRFYSLAPLKIEFRNYMKFSKIFHDLSNLLSSKNFLFLFYFTSRIFFRDSQKFEYFVSNKLWNLLYENLMVMKNRDMTIGDKSLTLLTLDNLKYNQISYSSRFLLEEMASEYNDVISYWVPTENNFQNEVKSTLDSINMPFSPQLLLETLHIDILIEKNKALEMNTPLHYFIEYGKEDSKFHLSRPIEIKATKLQSKDYVVLNIPFYEWNLQRENWKKQYYLRNLINR